VGAKTNLCKKIFKKLDHLQMLVQVMRNQPQGAIEKGKKEKPF
jgi:hypothetical protein